MSALPPSVAKRRVYAKDDGNGYSSIEWTLTPVSVTDVVHIVCEPIATLPVIFVPGIMGSNLKLTTKVDGIAKDGAVWLMNGKAGAAWDWAGADAAARQRRLNPATTAVFDRGDVPSEVASIGDAEAIRARRYWGEVSAMSYGDFLVWLQRMLNHSGRFDRWRAEAGRADLASCLAPGMTFEALTDEALFHAAEFRFPVYACGYNWLESNLVAARTLAARIEKVIAANNSESYHCEQVILVTHSMGGLVARACSELVGMRAKIAGIVHGVMPATGAAVAYRRVRAGTEGAAGWVLGNTADKVTAVFANAPGALQLLPNRHYGREWLTIGLKYNAGCSAALPVFDPYEEIYKQRGQWWALIREELINPARSKTHKCWNQYLDNIDAAAGFHGQLATRYHPNTVSFYGAGTDAAAGLTWKSVTWKGLPEIPSTEPSPDELVAMKPLTDAGDGQLSTRGKTGVRYRFVVGDRDSPGDGTVPVVSGRVSGRSEVTASYAIDLGEEGHEGAYRVPLARRAALHSILSFAQKVPVLS